MYGLAAWVYCVVRYNYPSMARERLSLFMFRGRGEVGGERASLGHSHSSLLLSSSSPGVAQIIHFFLRLLHAPMAASRNIFLRLQPMHRFSEHIRQIILFKGRRPSEKRAKFWILNGTPQLFIGFWCRYGEIDKIKLGKPLFPIWRHMLSQNI